MNNDLDPVILLSADRRPIGTLGKRIAHSTDTPFHTGFSCYLFDAAGRVLITRRAITKQTWPGVWTNSCCGHPLPGESLPAAAARRAEYELGVTPEQLRMVSEDFCYRAVDDSGIVEYEHCPILAGTIHADPRPRAAEVAAWRWVEWGRLVRVAAEMPSLISPWAALQIPHVDSAREGLTLAQAR
jgi:isopentenyl-diphosphate delta-isomerase